jgi:hypothetical protein
MQQQNGQLQKHHQFVQVKQYPLKNKHYDKTVFLETNFNTLQISDTKKNLPKVVVKGLPYKDRDGNRKLKICRLKNVLVCI